jgi:hypothetical protein
MPSELTKSDPVKDDIDAQSGRFEFFKLTSTLGTAGLGGMAALFTDSTKIPSDLGSIILAGSCGVLFILTVFSCVSGEYSYANLLSARARETKIASSDDQRPIRIKAFEKSILNYSKLAYVTLLCTGLALLSFAGLRMFYHSSVSPEAALDVARQLISKEVDRENEWIQLEHLGVEGGDFLIKFGISPGLRKYIVRIGRKTGQVEEIGEENTKSKTQEIK